MVNSTNNTNQRIYYERCSSAVTASAIYTGTLYFPKIRKVIFNDPATMYSGRMGQKQWLRLMTKYLIRRKD